MNFGIFAVILAVVGSGMAIISRWDRPILLNGGQRLMILLVAFMESMCIWMLFSEEIQCGVVSLWEVLSQEDFMSGGDFSWSRLLFGIYAGCLLLACVTDLKLCQVYNFVWWLALGAASGLLWIRFSCVGEAEEMCIIISNLAFFCGLQLFLFKRMYGMADCYAFMVCGVAEAALGMEIVGYLWHMLLAYILLAVVQCVKGNIAKNGNLKRPVPFLPYIMSSFWILILFKFCLC